MTDVQAKGIRLAVIKFIATIIVSLCTLCTELEAPMTYIIDSTPTTVTTEVSNTAGRPSA